MISTRIGLGTGGVPVCADGVADGRNGIAWQRRVLKAARFVKLATPDSIASAAGSGLGMDHARQPVT